MAHLLPPASPWLPPPPGNKGGARGNQYIVRVAASTGEAVTGSGGLPTNFQRLRDRRGLGIIPMPEANPDPRGGLVGRVSEDGKPTSHLRGGWQC